MDTIEKYRRCRDKLLKNAGVIFQSKKVETDGPVKHVHFLELGTGKPLIIIHGGGSNSNEWINILKPLSEQFHLYVVDRPGCGLSDNLDYSHIDIKKSAVSFVRSFMESTGLDKALFVCQSMGGYFGICFAIEYPERVEKLLLIGAPAGMNLWIPYLLRALGTRGLNKILAKTVAKPSLRSSEFIHKHLLVAQPEKLSVDYLTLSHYGEMLPGGLKGFMSLLENVLTLRGWRKDLYIADQLNKLQIPVRFIWGDKDAFENPDSGKQKAMAIRDVQFEVVENAGHCPWLDEPQKCSELIINMLKN
jgi:pimeloyl-ACP methyl ester carboxylesterase